MNIEYGFGKPVQLPFGAAVERVIEELRKEGFGVLSDIDVRATIKNKLDADIAPYRILGACNPQLAHRALAVEPDIGLLLPCNVVVRQELGGEIVVGFMNPAAVLGLVNRQEVAPIADEVTRRLRRVMDALP